MILVTGGTGLLGSHLLYELVNSGSKVIAVKRDKSHINIVKDVFSLYSEESEELFSRIKWIEADLFDIHAVYEAMENVTDVYHCAAVVSFLQEDKKLMMKTNVEATANIVNAAMERNIRKLCYVSSIATLGRADNDDIIDENTYWKNSNKNSNYSISKYYGENEVWRGINEGLNAVIVNPAIIFGPGFWHKGSSDLVKTIYHGLRYYPDGVNGFVDVRDVVRVMIILMKSDISSERFILSAANMPYKELFEHLAGYLGVKPPVRKFTRLLAGIYWRYEMMKSLLTKSKPLLSKETACTAYEKYYYSNKKILTAIDYEFTAFDDTLKFLADSFKEHLNCNNESTPESQNLTQRINNLEFRNKY